MSYFAWLALVSAAVLWFQSGSFMPRVTTLIQRSVAICKDDFIASRLASLAGHFGAKVACFAIASEGFPSETECEAREFVSRILKTRRQHRGRKF